jgi:adenylate kinase family enzyme
MSESLSRGACGRRISVVGTSGSGKTTTAGQIAERLGIPHVELDALHWEPNWAEAAFDVFCQRLSQAISGDVWVVDGNYGKSRHIVLSGADTVVWRTLKRSIRREELWSGNRESLSRALFSRESILLWALQTYKRRRREYPALLNQPEYAHLAVTHLRSPRETRAWVAGLARCDP